jgi:predicted nucleic-acid-binding Zn-ribbon protein
MQQGPPCPACGGMRSFVENAVDLRNMSGHLNALFCLNCGYTTLYADQSALGWLWKKAQKRR